jgi:hypothetical protein
MREGGGVSPLPEAEGVGSRSTAVTRFEGVVEVDDLRKRIVAERSKGARVEVDGLRKRTVVARSKGGGVEVDSLRKRTAVVRSKAGVKVAVCSEAEIKDGRWRRRHDGF